MASAIAYQGGTMKNRVVRLVAVFATSLGLVLGPAVVSAQAATPGNQCIPPETPDTMNCWYVYP